MFQKKNPMSVFYDGYIERNPIEWVKRFGRQWKWAYQRAMKGYCDADASNIYNWFLSIIPDMLDNMADSTPAFPEFPNDGTYPQTQVVDLGDADGTVSNKLVEWKKMLRTMAQLIRDADENMSSVKNKYEEEWSKAYDEFHEQYGLFGEKLEADAIKNKKSAITMHFPDELPQWRDIMRKFREEELKVLQKRADNFREGMALFVKWFWDLHD